MSGPWDFFLKTLIDKKKLSQFSLLALLTMLWLHKNTTFIKYKLKYKLKYLEVNEFHLCNRLKKSPSK